MVNPTVPFVVDGTSSPVSATRDPPSRVAETMSPAFSGKSRVPVRSQKFSATEASSTAPAGTATLLNRIEATEAEVIQPEVPDNRVAGRFPVNVVNGMFVARLALVMALAVPDTRPKARFPVLILLISSAASEADGMAPAGMAKALICTLLRSKL